MYLIKTLFVVFSVLISIVIVDIRTYDYLKKQKSISDISSKMSYVIPAFSFISHDYKEFVYGK
jgi:hypothetical protein